MCRRESGSVLTLNHIIVSDCLYLYMYIVGDVETELGDSAFSDSDIMCDLETNGDTSVALVVPIDDHGSAIVLFYQLGF